MERRRMVVYTYIYMRYLEVSTYLPTYLKRRLAVEDGVQLRTMKYFRRDLEIGGAMSSLRSVSR